MPYIIGFLIALFIALTGVGAGTVTVPVLILFLGVPSSEAVGIGLVFATAVKLILIPAQIAGKKIAWRPLGYMLLGGLPGVVLGSIFLKSLVTAGSQNLLNIILGVILVGTSAWQLIYSFRPLRQNPLPPDRTTWLAWLMFPVGAEVGFSSAGAGALGSAALLSLTVLDPARVVGTDIAFGFLISLVGSGLHLSSLGASGGLILHLIEGGALGAVGGVFLSSRVPRRPLRVALWSWLLILGGQFLFTSYHTLTVSAHPASVDTAAAPRAKQ